MPRIFLNLISQHATSLRNKIISSGFVVMLLATVTTFVFSACCETLLAGEAYTDPAKTDADFPFQGEYTGTVKIDGTDTPVGVQVVALGDSKFSVVAYGGGLPGAGWNSRDKFIGNGNRDGSLVSISGMDGDGVKRRGEIRENVIRVFGKNDSDLIGTLSKTIRKSPTFGTKPPAGSLVIFDGTSVEKLTGGRMTADKLLMQGVTSKDLYSDAEIHIEFLLPYMPKDQGQARGNSGAYIQGRYEVQMLDSFGLEGKNNECGGIYSVAAPSVNMCFPPLQWQTYDISYIAPKYAGDKKTVDGRMTVRHNGVLIHDNVAIPTGTPGGPLGEAPGPGPLYLQDHGNPVRYQNIWVLPKS